MPNIGLMYALSAGADSIRTFDQSASSSSASSMGSDVVTPWPISERSTTTSTLSSAPMRSHAFGANGAAASGAPPRPRPEAGRWNPMTSPAPAAPVVSRNSRRVMPADALMSRSLGGAVDGGANPLIGAAAADVGHRGVDIRVARVRILRQQRGRGHDLSRLAIAALRHVFLDPRPLHGVCAVLRETLDGGHALAGHGRHRQHARARGGALQVDGTGAALRDAAAELGACEAERVAQHPKERGVGGDVDGLALAVDGKGDRRHERVSSRKMKTTCSGGRVDGRGEGHAVSSCRVTVASPFIYRGRGPGLTRAGCLVLPLLGSLAGGPASAQGREWTFGPFEKPKQVNPVITPSRVSTFVSPMNDSLVHWEEHATFNPAAVVRRGRVYVLYRAEDASGEMQIGRHTSRLGLAESEDGLRFSRRGAPVLYPAKDGQARYEWPGGVEDPRLVETEEGVYVLTYTQWNRDVPRLAVATSSDLVHWTKHGPA